ncbi:Beta-galactosidase 8 isoform 1 [Dorcoceras hygrometricum]|uniref:Beta-galactosidase n=1 Tax=Dorcoceras hygrometricum TaxID=472368 RepID=A0A2Z7BMF3_9LAMI|nr:Beta-galactosidase 8 isoform 1 [Dorcoceras hygrometricum]
MFMRSGMAGVAVALLVVLSLTARCCFGANVTYDHRAIVIDGQRKVFISGSIHYARSTPEMWPDLIQKSKDGGLDVIQTYIFWNLHEEVRGQYDFEGRKDVVKFVKLVGEAGLLVHLRIGPYACAEWNYGGFPLWLHFIPGIEFRTDNEPFKAEMKRFTAKIVDLMKGEELYASQGGPIILSQIENEYGNVQSGYGSGAAPYVKWAASMAVSLGTGVPWVMCQQSDAPDPIINTCNGFYCDQFTPNSNKKPKMWTENWSGFSSFGDPVPYRPTEDLAFSVARFYQLGGTFQNYYMYQGGTNFGRSSGGPFITTSYDYDAPIDEYGLLRQPKWGHLKDVHKVIKLCEEAMVATDPQTTSLGPNLEATVYKTESGLCAAFLANVDTKSAATVKFNGNSYNLPAWSVSILPDCKNVALNTAKINSVATVSKFVRQPSKFDTAASDASISGWSWITEPVGISSDNAWTKLGLLEQINTTADRSDYLWYSRSIDIKGDESKTVLHVDSLGHALHVFINGEHAGSGKGSHDNRKVSIDVPCGLTPGKNKIDLLSLTVGLQNYGAHYDTEGAGITGPVKLKGLQNGSTIDLSSDQWTYQIGLKGEDLGLSSGSSSLWVSQPTLPKNQPLVWYKTTFDAPPGSSPVALDFTGMGKGQAWINGQSIGRYWPTNTAPKSGCTDSCDYRGSYQPSKCQRNCGAATQKLYHVPRAWLQPSGNVMVLFEETGGDPTQLSFATKETQSICSKISDSHPIPVDMWASDKETTKNAAPTLSLHCPSPDQIISQIKFASFGTPSGKCGSFSHGPCSSRRALAIVRKACIGLKECSIGVSVNTFGDPCSGVAKSLAVEASCT